MDIYRDESNQRYSASLEVFAPSRNSESGPGRAANRSAEPSPLAKSKRTDQPRRSKARRSGESRPQRSRAGQGQPSAKSNPTKSTDRQEATALKTNPKSKKVIAAAPVESTQSEFEAFDFEGLGSATHLEGNPDAPDLETVPQAEATIPMLIGMLPSWMVSMIVHICILLLLAVMTLGIQDKGQVVLEISDSPNSLNDMAMEVVLEPDELDELEDNLDSLTPEDSSTATPDVQLAADMLEDFSEANALMAAEDVPWDEMVGEGDEGTGGTDEAEQPDGESKGAKFYGIESEGTRFVFVIDCSGSMDQEYRWFRAVKELKESIRNLDYDQEFLVYVYNSHTWAMFRSNPVEVDLVTANDDNKERVYRWLNGFAPVGNTFPALSMKLSLHRRPDAIFMLSDGELMDNTVMMLRVWNSSDRSDQVPIHTVFLGNGPGRLTMEAIAGQNSGQFKWAK